MNRLFVLLGLLALLPVACNRGANAPAVVTGPKSAPGWEVRYNAAAALARRGSEKALDPRVKETLLEMLDEEQQMRNFTIKDEAGQPRTDAQGRELTDANGARLTVVTTMHALGELHRKRPELDLSEFRPAVEKLTQSTNLAVSIEAKKAMQWLEK